MGILSAPGQKLSFKGSPKLASKMVNSGHTEKSTRVMIVQGVTKYLDNVRLSELPEEDKFYRPLYLDKKHQKTALICVLRRKQTCLTKSNRFKII